MRDKSDGKGGFYVVVGTLIAVAAVMFVMITEDHPLWEPHQVDIHIAAPHMPGH